MLIFEAHAEDALHLSFLCDVPEEELRAMFTAPPTEKRKHYASSYDTYRSPAHSPVTGWGTHSTQTASPAEALLRPRHG